jgi:8-oxo-dGTP pyrophosphatase MutT (NUDIX family)
MIRAAGLLILNAQGQALFVQRGPGSDYPQMWAFPGGRREGDESAEETAIRETAEEVGHTFKKEDLKFWVRSCRPQENSTLVTPPTNEDVDFTTFLVKNAADFTPLLNEEHTAYAWADINTPPAPLHPGCSIALRRFTMDDELQVAQAMRDGELVSPEEYGNIHLFALRISGTGTAVRGEKRNAKDEVTHKAEVVYRRPENYLTPEFLTRCNGLPVIILHPEEAILNTKQFAERIVGTIMLPYIKGDEVWGIARIYDRDAALALNDRQLSTSPWVLLGSDNTSLTLEGGTEVLIEGKPSLLDHLAICERGVWDKGGDPTGVQNIHTRTDGDGDMKIELKRINGETEEGYKARCDEAATMLKARADSGGTDKLDQLLDGIKGIKTVVADLKARVDSAEEKETKKDADEAEKKKVDAKGRSDKFEFPKKDADDDDMFKKKMDAAEKALCDSLMESGESEEVASDAAKKRRKDAEDEDTKAEKEAKDKKDEDEKEKEAKKDAQTVASLRDTVAKLEEQIKGAMTNNTDVNRTALLQSQARFDSAHTALGGQARAPLLGETLQQYRIANLRELQKYSPDYKDKDVGLLAINDSFLDMAETKIIADAVKAASNPTDIATGTLVMRSRQDGGHTYNEFHGETAAWMRPLAGPVKVNGKSWVNPAPGARR